MQVDSQVDSHALAQSALQATHPVLHCSSPYALSLSRGMNIWAASKLSPPPLLAFFPISPPPPPTPLLLT